MPRGDAWDERTPVTDIADPKRSLAEAELQVAQATARDLKQEWLRQQDEIRELKTKLREQDAVHAEIVKEKNLQIRRLETAAAQLRTSLKSKR